MMESFSESATDHYVRTIRKLGKYPMLSLPNSMMMNYTLMNSCISNCIFWTVLSCYSFKQLENFQLPFLLFIPILHFWTSVFILQLNISLLIWFGYLLSLYICMKDTTNIFNLNFLTIYTFYVISEAIFVYCCKPTFILPALQVLTQTDLKERDFESIRHENYIRAIQNFEYIINASVWVCEKQQDNECSICHDALESERNVIQSIRTKCNHSFHANCISLWMCEQTAMNTTCPLCLSDL